MPVTESLSEVRTRSSNCFNCKAVIGGFAIVTDYSHPKVKN